MYFFRNLELLETFESCPSSDSTGASSTVRVCSQLLSLARRRKVSPSRQSSARGSSFLAKGSGWQHQSSTMEFQLPLGRGRTRLNTLKERGKQIKQLLSIFVKWCLEMTSISCFCCESWYYLISKEFPNGRRWLKTQEGHLRKVSKLHQRHTHNIL